MKTHRATALVMLAILLVGCASSAPRKPEMQPSPLRSSPQAASGPAAPKDGQATPHETTIDIARSTKPYGTSTSEQAKRPVLPSMTGKVETGLMSPTPQQKPAAPPLQAGEKQKVVLNFEKADISEVTNQIFGDYLKLSYVLDPTLQGRISLYLEGEFSKDELFQMVTKAYEANGISIVPRKGIYYIQSIQRSSSSSLPIANSLILQDKKDGMRPVIVIYRLRFMDVKQAVNTVKSFLTPGRPIVPDTMTNSILFVEDQDNAKSIIDILKALDINILQEVSMEIVPLQAINPQDAVQSMEALINKLGLFKESNIKNNVAFIPLLSYGGVLVLAQSAEMLKTAKYWLTALDIQGQETGEQIYVYFLQNGLAIDISNILSQLFGLKGGGEKRPGEQIVSSGKQSYGGTSSKQPFGSSSSSGSFGGSSSGSSFGGSSSFGSSSFGGSSSTGSSLKGTSSGTQTGTSGGRAGGGSSTRGTGATGTVTTLTGEVVIIPDEVNNAIVVRANAADYARIKKTIETMDILPRAVLIEVLIAEVRLNKDLSYGLEYFFRNIGLKVDERAGSIGGSFSPDSNLVKLGTSSFDLTQVTDVTSLGGLNLFWGSLDKNIATILNLLASKSDVKVLSTPTLLATDNKEASITVGGRQPIPSSSAVSDTGNSLVSSIQYADTGILLTVTPHISAGGLVRLEVDQTIRNVDATVTVGNGASAPTFTERDVKTTLTAQSGSTVVIGGIIQQNDNKSKSGIPLLQDLPLISSLFSKKSDHMDRTELIIAITPHVVDHRETANTRDFMNQLKQLKSRLQER